MIINIDGDDLESLEQLKGYFNPDPTPDSQVFADLLDYGQHGDLSGWLREHGEEGMASRVDAIQEGLSDSKYYAALKQVVTGKTMEDDGGMKPSFERCCHLEGVDCDIEGSEAKIKVRLRVLMSVNEEYRLEVKSGWGTRPQLVNLSQYVEGETTVLTFELCNKLDQELGNLVITADGKELDYKEEALGNENQDFEIDGVSFKMIRVEGGTFTMGDTTFGWNHYDDERPAHKVTLSTFYIGETPVTKELWKAVMGRSPGYFEGNNLPIESLSWDDCQVFVSKLNQLTGKHFRLPTEAEWEYAARGGSKSCGYEYSGSNNLDEVAWYYANYDIMTHFVKMRKPNELGIYDMTGNVYEWCSDWYGDYNSGSQTNPQGPNSGMYRVYRGGSTKNYAIGCCVSNRDRGDPSSSHYHLGLRLVLES